MITLFTSEGILWVGVPIEGEIRFVLPVFSNNDNAFAFLEDIMHEGELVHVNRIKSIDDVSALIGLIDEQKIVMVLLDPPNPKFMDREAQSRTVYWSGNEFGCVLLSLIDISKTHGEAAAFDVLRQYLEARIKDARNYEPSEKE